MRWFLILFAALLIGSGSASQEPPQGKGKQQKPAAEQRGTEKAPIFVKTPSPTSQAERDYEDYEKLEKPRNERRITSATVALPWITGLLALFTFGLWIATYRLVKDAKDTAQKELRAYLGAANGTLYFILNSNHLRATIELRNSGQTPAQNVSYAIDGEIRLPNDKTPFKELVSGQRNQPIAPGSAWTVGHEFLNLSDADKQDILSDKKYVFIWRRADYFDIFGKPQTVKFRYRNVVKNLIPLDGGQTGIQNWFFYPEEDGNEAT